MASRRIEVAPGVALNVYVHPSETPGSPDGFVLVHGLASNARMWDGVAVPVTAAGRAVAAVDLRGHGHSDQPDHGYAVREVATDVAAVIEGLGWERAVVVGQSWGGNVVLDLAVQRPDLVSGAAAVDGGDIELSARFPDWETCAAALAPPKLDGLTVDRFEAMLRERHPDWPESGIQGFLANFSTGDDGVIAPRLPRNLHMRVLRGLWEHRPSQRYLGLKVPVLFLGADDGSHGMAEKREHMEKVAALLPRGEVRWLRGDHDLHAQQPEVVARALLEHFR